MFNVLRFTYLDLAAGGYWSQKISGERLARGVLCSQLLSVLYLLRSVTTGGSAALMALILVDIKVCAKNGRDIIKYEIMMRHDKILEKYLQRWKL